MSLHLEIGAWGANVEIRSAPLSSQLRGDGRSYPSPAMETKWSGGWAGSHQEMGDYEHHALLDDYVGCLGVTSDCSAYLGCSFKFKIGQEWQYLLSCKGSLCPYSTHLGDNHLTLLSHENSFSFYCKIAEYKVWRPVFHSIDWDVINVCMSMCARIAE